MLLDEIKDHDINTAMIREISRHIVQEPEISVQSAVLRTEK